MFYSQVNKGKMMSLLNVFKDILNNKELNSEERHDLERAVKILRDTHVNILITGATGCGKSSTINALFSLDQATGKSDGPVKEVAKVGVGVDPETMDIAKYELENMTIWDSPGLGDGEEADQRHRRNIINKLLEKDSNGNAVIDLVLVLLDGGSRDLGTSYELINNVIINTLKKSGEGRTDRLLVAINQCDMAMKGRNWDAEAGRPNAALENFLEEKVCSTRKRIQEATGVTVNPIYFSAGFKSEDEEQRPYNITRLLRYIITAMPSEKRVIVAEKINVEEIERDTSRRKQEERQEIDSSIGSALEKILGAAGGAVKEVVSTIASGVGTLIGGAAKAIGGMISTFAS